LKEDLNRKNLNIEYGLTLITADTKPYIFNEAIVNISTLNALSNSTFLPENSSLKIDFTNTTFEILKRILTGILLSTLLVLVVISCLFYLLNIIRHQKQIAEVKNDFISNITHEFKTPISTIGVALESIKNFNVLNDTEKTKAYIDMSNSQLSKLNMMVEKLLETASLDSENLQLSKEQSNVTELIQGIVSKHNLELANKSITFNPSKDDISAKIDAFHFENAINNIIDNAIKYGGNEIKVNLQKSTLGFTIIVSDNGNKLAKENKDKIFEKFYRIPKGNTHDVKGFGIGLYYAKKIIEKHDGAIQLDLDNKWTTFKISMPNG
jgi:two-component system phosphate regulon sensor histidine kinase PhoR